MLALALVLVPCHYPPLYRPPAAPPRHATNPAPSKNHHRTAPQHHEAAAAAALHRRSFLSPRGPPTPRQRATAAHLHRTAPPYMTGSPSPPPPPTNPSRRRGPIMSSSSSLKQEDTVSSPELPPLAMPGIAAAAAAAAAAASSGGGGGGVGGGVGSGRRLPPPCWTHEETLALIEAYRDKWEALKKGNLRAADWDEVAGAVTARCGRFPTATYKSGVQCRHKIEKLRKRYRAERSRSMGRSKGPKWPFFPLLHDLAGGGAPDPSPNPIIKIKPRGIAAGATPASPSPVSSPSSDEAGRSRSLHGLISNGGGGSGLRFTIPKGSRTKPGVPREPRPDRGEEDPEADAMAEVATALRAVGEGFLRMEERRLELALQMEKDRMESEMKRTQTLLDAQQLFVEAFLSKQPHHKKAKLVSSAAAMEED